MRLGGRGEINGGLTGFNRDWWVNGWGGFEGGGVF